MATPKIAVLVNFEVEDYERCKAAARVYDEKVTTFVRRLVKEALAPKPVFKKASDI